MRGRCHNWWNGPTALSPPRDSIYCRVHLCTILSVRSAHPTAVSILKMCAELDLACRRVKAVFPVLRLDSQPVSFQFAVEGDPVDTEAGCGLGEVAVHFGKGSTNERKFGLSQRAGGRSGTLSRRRDDLLG